MYEVQTFVGSHRKHFYKEYKAKEYKKKLAKKLDIEEDLIEICEFEPEDAYEEAMILTED